MLHVIAMITAHPGQRGPLLALFRAIVPAVRAEAGCIAYEATVDAEGLAGFPMTVAGADTFVVVEKWASADALKAHAVSAHMRAYAGKAKALIASRVIHVLAPA
jgi:quinol monooxygenase YgiN